MSADLRARLGVALAPGYRIDRELGGGGMSRVFVALEVAFGRQVVIKVLPPAFAAQVSAERFRQEVRVLAQLQHPNIVPLLTAGEIPDLHGAGQAGEYYVMPFVSGPSLRSVLDTRGALPLADVMAVLREVTQALEHAHSRGIVHRDIKPENVLLSGGVAVVADFGIAKALAASRRAPDASARADSAPALTLAGVALGTPRYMAPEQGVGDPATDHRADLYALGVVGFELLAGRPPFRGPTVQQFAAQHLTVPPPDLRSLRPDIPRALAELMHRLLGKTPDERPRDATEVLRALKAIRIPTTASMAAIPRRRWRRAAAWGAVIAAVTTGVLLVRRGGAPSVSAEDAMADRRVLVATLEDGTGSADLRSVGAMASDWIARELTQSGLADVMPAGLLMQPGEGTVPIELARRTGARMVVTGRYYLAGADSIRFELSVLDARTGQVLRALAPVTGSRNNLVGALTAMQERVSGGLAAAMDTVFQTYAGPEAAPSYQAYAEYVEAQRLYWGASRSRRLTWSRRLDSSLVLFRRAAALDTSFPTPAIWIALASSVDNDCIVADSIVRVLTPRRANFSTWDRLLFDLVPLRCAGDWAGALRVSEERLRAFPHSSHVRFLITIYALNANHPRRALEIIESLDVDRDMRWLPESEPHIRYSVNAMDAHILLGNYGAADSVAVRLRSAEPREPYTAWLRARTLAMAGRPEAADMLDSALAYSPGSVRDVQEAVLMLRHARVLAATGQADAAARTAARGLAVPVIGDSLTPAARAEMEELAGRYDAAMARATRAPLRGTLVGYRVQGRVAARRGDRAGALAVEAALERRAAQWPLGAAYLAQAEIAALLGERERAVTLLQRLVAAGGGSAGAGPWLQLRQTPALAGLNGFAPYEDLMQPQP